MDVTGKQPVWSVETLPVSLNALTKTWWDRTGVLCWIGRTIGDGAMAGLVDRTFCWFCLICPFAVAINLGRFLHTSSEVSLGQVANYPVPIDLVQV